MVNVIQGENVKGFKINAFIFKGFLFGAGEKYPGKSKQAEDLVHAELDGQVPGIPVPEFIQFQLLVKHLKDSIADDLAEQGYDCKFLILEFS